MALVVVTGANSGIGLELARQYSARGDTVVAACRRTSDELDLAGAEVCDGVDVTDDAGVARLAKALAGRTVDILVNNAGILIPQRWETLDLEAMRAQYEVNTLGPIRVTRALLPSLASGSRVAIVSSRVGSIADNATGGNHGYRVSKAAVNMAGVNLAHDLKPKGIAVVLLHPGYVRTRLTGNAGGMDPADSARGLIARIDELTLERTGTFWHMEGYQLPW